LSEPLVGQDVVAQRYLSLVDGGVIALDQAQLTLARKLDALNQTLGERRLASKTNALGWLFAARAAAPKGLYIHGGVGRGKTMLMDMFFSQVPHHRKRRAHFHQFMADVHDRIHVVRKAIGAGDAASGDPIAPVAAEIAAQTRLLCLDEFAVEDVADAMILSRLFGRLFEDGLVLVATSNTAPDGLYATGLNRGLFLPFVELLKRRTEVVDLRARTDYRLEKLARAPVYVTPLGDMATAALDRVWLALTGLPTGAPGVLTAKGRQIRVPAAVDGVARFGFSDLCEQPLGAADYGLIARAYQTVIVDGIPRIARERRDTARRFINLVDVFYDQGVKLIASAAAEPDELYPAGDGEEAFAFRRTASRLIEMRSEAYLAAPRGPRGREIGRT